MSKAATILTIIGSALGVLVIVLGAQYSMIDTAVTKQVNAKLEAQESVSVDRMKAAEDRITRTEEADDKMDDKITRIIDILLEE